MPKVIKFISLLTNIPGNVWEERKKIYQEALGSETPEAIAIGSPLHKELAAKLWWIGLNANKAGYFQYFPPLGSFESLTDCHTSTKIICPRGKIFLGDYYNETNRKAVRDVFKALPDGAVAFGSVLPLIALRIPNPNELLGQIIPVYVDGDDVYTDLVPKWTETDQYPEEDTWKIN